MIQVDIHGFAGGMVFQVIPCVILHIMFSHPPVDSLPHPMLAGSMFTTVNDDGEIIILTHAMDVWNHNHHGCEKG